MENPLIALALLATFLVTVQPRGRKKYFLIIQNNSLVYLVFLLQVAYWQGKSLLLLLFREKNIA